MKFKVGDRVKYDSGNPETVDTGIITEADPAHWFYETRPVEAYYIHWDKYPDDNGWIAIGNLTSIVEPTVKSVETSPTVKSAVEAKAELEKKILEQIQEYNKTYGVNVSRIDLETYVSTQIGGNRVYNYDVHVEVRL